LRRGMPIARERAETMEMQPAEMPVIEPVR
jgi:hypothetical protein